MIILSYRYEMDCGAEKIYQSYQELEEWTKKLGYVRRVVRLNSSGACETLLVSTLFGKREELLKLFRISKPLEQIEMELLSPTQLICYYRGKWSFESTETGCRVEVKHVVDVNWTLLPFLQAGLDRNKEIKLTKKILKKIDRAVFSHMKNQNETIALGPARDHVFKIR